MLARRFKLTDAAVSIGVSPRALQRRLAENGLTYSRLLEQTRIETARTWLDGSDLKLAEIAAELGYRHSTHFSRAFKRVCGVNPRAYRSFAQQ